MRERSHSAPLVAPERRVYTPRNFNTESRRSLRRIAEMKRVGGYAGPFSFAFFLAAKLAAAGDSKRRRQKLRDVPGGIHVRVMSSAGNQTIGFAPDLLRRNRNRLRRSALIAGLILFASGLIGMIGWHWQRSPPRPDYYKILVTDLAEQHHRLTGTATIARENERALDYLDRLYNRKARRDKRPEESVSVDHNGLLHFSFLPGTIGWVVYPFAYLAEQRTAPSMAFTEPSGKPLALWVFSRPERALAIVFAEEPVVEDLADPGPRIIETINRSGAVAVAGEFESAEVALVHAYLLPLDKLQLDAPGAWAGDTAALEQVVGSVPLLFGVGAGSATGRTRLDAGQSLARLVTASGVFFDVAAIMRWVVLPAALLWSAWTLLRLRRVRREWNNNLLSRVVQGNQTVPCFGFFRFLTADLIIEAGRLLAEAAEQRREEASQHQEQLRREGFVTEIRDCLKMLARLGQGSPCDEGWLAGATTVEMEEMAARCRQLVEQHQEQVEGEQQAARERARQIHWLESEFAAIPPEKRMEVPGAWALYEQACAVSDPGKRLEKLKAARKLLPKEFRSEQL